MHEREFLRSQGTLDRLCSTLTEYNTPAELDKEIRELFKSLDREGTGKLQCTAVSVQCSILSGFCHPLCLRFGQTAHVARCASFRFGSVRRAQTSCRVPGGWSVPERVWTVSALDPIGRGAVSGRRVLGCAQAARDRRVMHLTCDLLIVVVSRICAGGASNRHPKP